jgi:hypothetical protein
MLPMRHFLVRMLADKQVPTPGDVQLLTGGPPCQVRRLFVMLCVLRALPL